VQRVLIIHEVDDYDAWKAVFDGAAGIRRHAGERDYELLQDWHRARYLVLPGMTGLWQISGRAGLSFDDLVRLDFTYLENWSIWLDVTIIAKTIPAVISGRGAY